MTTRLLFALLLLAFGVINNAALANGLEINLSGDSVWVKYSKRISGTQFGRNEAGAGILYNTNDNIMFEADLTVIDETGSKTPGLDAGVGPKIYVGATKNREYLSFALGGLLAYRPLIMNRVVMQVHGYYAPSIVSWIDADHMWEVGGRIGYEIVPSAQIYVGYRKIYADVDIKKERTIEENAVLGLLMNF